MSAYAQSCIARSTPSGVVAHISTAYTVEDWNSVRVALGYEKMSYIGLS